MLKLHHMNLLNEIQETNLMMNLYQQQQIQNQLANADALTNGDSQMNLMMQQKNQANNMNNYDHMMSGNKLTQQQQQRASLGLGGDDQLSFAQQMMMQQQQQNLLSNGNPSNLPLAPEDSNAPGPTSKTAAVQSKSESPKPEDGKPEKKKVTKKAAQAAKHKEKAESIPSGSNKEKDKV